MFFLKKNVSPHGFFTKMFLSLLASGIIQIVLMGIFMIIFSNNIIANLYSDRSEERLNYIKNQINLIIAEYGESARRLSLDPVILETMTSEFPLNTEINSNLTEFYQHLYQELSGKIYKAEIHLVSTTGNRSYSTHTLPEIFDPSSPEESISTYERQQENNPFFALITNNINSSGDRTGISLFYQLFSEEGKDLGYIIIDLKKSFLAESINIINSGFFDDIYLMDNKNYRFSNLLKDGKDGLFSKIPWYKIPCENVIMTNDSLINTADLAPTNIVLAGKLQINTISTYIQTIFRIMLIILLLGLVLSVILTFTLAKSLSRPVMLLARSMKEFEEGNLSKQITNFRNDEFEILFEGFNSMALEIKELVELREKKQQELRTAEKRALQAQINPHFLYNTLNTIKSIAKLNHIDEISIIVTQLGKLLRENIDTKEEFTTIKESINIVEGYLQIQKYRYGASFDWKIDIPASFEPFRLPRLIIQPIVENAVIHGLEEMMGQRNIIIKGNTEDYCIYVENNGKIFPEKTWKEALQGSYGIGIKNVDQRLKLYFGKEAGLSCTSRQGKTVIRIQFGKGALN